MSAEYVLGLLAVLGLMVYLVAVLVNPEDFT
jgi:K+-transporting ATPase KdpF subunit